MAPAFVSGMSVAANPSFSGTSLPACPATPATVTMTVAPLNRRQALLAGAALLSGAPLAAFAKSGDAPKISFFGVGGASSPFTAGLQTGGNTLYTKFNEDEIAVFKRIVEESKARLIGADGSIKQKSWEDIRSRIRLEASELRTVQLKINSAIADAAARKTAEKAAAGFKRELEALDQACIQKNQDMAKKKYDSSIKALSAWQDAAGVSA